MCDFEHRRCQVLMQRDVSLKMALTIAMTASEQCGAKSVDRRGRPRRPDQGVDGGDEGSPHNLELARRKAYTARTFRSPSAAWAKRTETTNQGQRCCAMSFRSAAACPIMVGEDAIGGIGLSGAPGGQPKEEACASAGIAKVADQLK